MRLSKGIVGLALLMAVTAAHAIVIDDFSTGAYSMTANSSNPIAEAVRVGTMLGGERDALLSYLSGPSNVGATVDITGGGVQFFNANTQTTGSLTLQYDGLDGELETDGVLTPGTGLGANFSGDNAFTFDFRFLDAGLSASISIVTTVVSSNGTFTFTSFVGNGTNFQHQQLFSDFGGADFSNVQSVTFTFTGGPGADFTLEGIGTASIPGPAAAVPFLLGFAAMRRRRK